MFYRRVFRVAVPTHAVSAKFHKTVHDSLDNSRLKLKLVQSDYDFRMKAKRAASVGVAAAYIGFCADTFNVGVIVGALVMHYAARNYVKDSTENIKAIKSCIQRQEDLVRGSWSGDKSETELLADAEHLQKLVDAI